MAYEARPAGEADLPALVELYLARDMAFLGVADTDAENITALWGFEGFDVATDSLVVLRDDQAVGYAAIWGNPERTELDAELCLLPSLLDDEVGSRLLAFLESRASSLAADAGAVFGVYCEGNDERTLALLDAAGYRPERSFWRMAASIEGRLDQPRWPEGVTVRPFAPGHDDRAVHAVYADTFADHWHVTPSGFEAWAARSTGRSNYDPRLWFVAESESGPVGVLLGFPFDDVAWVQNLGVRLAWRGKGVGRALMQHAFRSFADLGFRRVELEVDGDNPTGATRLYESVGMTVVHRYIWMGRQVATNPRDV